MLMEEAPFAVIVHLIYTCDSISVRRNYDEKFILQSHVAKQVH